MVTPLSKSNLFNSVFSLRTTKYNRHVSIFAVGIEDESGYDDYL